MSKKQIDDIKKLPSFYLYHCNENKYYKEKEQRKRCTKKKCPAWRGVDSENLVWCNNWAIGDCTAYDFEKDKKPEPYGEAYVKLSDVLLILVQSQKQSGEK